jgi:hypothetical protein
MGSIVPAPWGKGHRYLHVGGMLETTGNRLLPIVANIEKRLHSANVWFQQLVQSGFGMTPIGFLCTSVVNEFHVHLSASSPRGTKGIRSHICAALQSLEIESCKRRWDRGMGIVSQFLKMPSNSICGCPWVAD